jgi:hypothetical protein
MLHQCHEYGGNKYVHEIMETLKVQFMIIYEDFFFRLHLRIWERRNNINESNIICRHSLSDI